MGCSFSIAESKIPALEEKLSCIDPHLALKSTSNDLPSTCSRTDDSEVEDEHSKLALILSDPAPDNTLTNSKSAKVEPHAFKPEC